jgi:hypothetical protein
MFSLWFCKCWTAFQKVPFEINFFPPYDTILDLVSVVWILKIRNSDVRLERDYRKVELSFIKGHFDSTYWTHYQVHFTYFKFIDSARYCLSEAEADTGLEKAINRNNVKILQRNV